MVAHLHAQLTLLNVVWPVSKLNNSVFADRKLTGDNGRSHLFLLRNSILLGIRR
jgi:hypothetical protein